MTPKSGAICKACRVGKVFSREVAQTFEHEGLEVKIDGIPALVCDNCGQVYFAPGIGNKIRIAASDLFALSKVKHAGQFKAAV